MPEYVLNTANESGTQAAGRALAPLVARGDVLVLSGDLGAGKTQLTKGLAAGLGVEEAVTSPTFNILLVHEGALTLNHFDLYRLETAEQLEDIDYWGTLESDGVSVVEWGDRFVEAVPDQCVVVRIHVTGDETRAIEVEPHGARGFELAHEWAEACASLPGVDVARGGAAS